ncbi:hypothetical protein ACOY39_27190, partial [Klebsiella pneumoniae]|uniref:hypothetical protein n=1 Tax=Klebsiella pneumoniae TaxID=573 RepID=UPI003BDC3432
VHHIWCPLSSQEFQDLPDGAETTLTVKKDWYQKQNRNANTLSLLTKLSESRQSDVRLTAPEYVLKTTSAD